MHNRVGEKLGGKQTNKKTIEISFTNLAIDYPEKEMSVSLRGCSQLEI